MTYVITEPCIGVKDKTCVECPAGCTTKASGCPASTPASADGGACEQVCPAEAVFYKDDEPGRGPSSPARTRSSPASSARPAAPPIPARCPTTPATSLAASPAGNATMSVRQISDRGRVSGGPVPGCLAARAAPWE